MTGASPVGSASLSLLTRLTLAATRDHEQHFQAVHTAQAQPFLAWVKGGGFVADREPIDFTVWRYLEQVYAVVPEDCAGLDITIKKPSQAGASIWGMLLMLWLLLRHRPIQGGYFLPTQDHALFFSSDRFLKLVRENAAIHRLMGRTIPEPGEDADEGAASVRRFAGSVAHFTYMGGVVTTESLPLDVLLFDEVQEMVLTAIQKAEERVSASLLRAIVRVSTANFEDEDIDYFYQRSDRRAFFTRCRCDPGIDLTESWDPEHGPLCIDHGSGATPSVPRAPFYVCPQCKTMLGPGGGPDRPHGMRVQEGRFVAANPDAVGPYGTPAIGLHWGQMLSPRQTAATILEKWARRVDTKVFYNRVLGRCYTDPKTQPVTEAHCRAAQRDYLSWGPVPPREVDAVVMGVDQMGHDCRAVLKARAGGTMRYLHVEWIQGAETWKRLGQLMREYRVRVCAIEALPNFDNAHAFGRDFDGRVWLVRYADLGDELVQWSDRPRDQPSVRKTDEEARARWTCRVDQYKMMSWSLARWSRGQVETPDARTLRQTIRTDKGPRTVEIFREVFWLHLQRVALVTEPMGGSEKKGERRLRRAVRKVGIDPHFAYANMLADVAWARVWGTERMLIDEEANVMGERKADEIEQVREAMPEKFEVIPPTVAGDFTCGTCQHFAAGQCELRRFAVTKELPGCDYYDPVPEGEEDWR